MSWFFDTDGPEFDVMTEPVARKPHKCCECGLAIPAGAKYVRVVGKWEGQLDTFKQHMVCAEACRAVRDKDLAGGCLPFGGLREFWCDLSWFHDVDGTALERFGKIMYCRRKYAAVERMISEARRKSDGN